MSSCSVVMAAVHCRSASTSLPGIIRALCLETAGRGVHLGEGKWASLQGVSDAGGFVGLSSFAGLSASAGAFVSSSLGVLTGLSSSLGDGSSSAHSLCVTTQIHSAVHMLPMIESIAASNSINRQKIPLSQAGVGTASQPRRSYDTQSA